MGRLSKKIHLIFTFHLFFVIFSYKFCYTLTVVVQKEFRMMENCLSREEILFFKNNLEEMQSKIIESLQQTTEELSGTKCCATGGDESDLASRQQGLNVRRSISEKQAKMLEEIEFSLKKIEDKTYGICEMCEEPINVERLKVKMFARYCISCREVVEKQEG